MTLDMLDVEKTLKDPEYKECLEQCLETNTVIEYKHGAGTGEYVHIEGVMPTLFNGVCTILKDVAVKERPERREGLLELVHKLVLEELAEEGYL